jgi:hypothetical protein
MADGGGASVEVEVFPVEAESSPLRRPVRRASSYSAWSWSAQAFSGVVEGAAEEGLCPQPVTELELGDRPAQGVGGEISRMPCASVSRNWALGCGRSFLTISRMPLGQPSRTPPVSSATQAPSRISPSASTAGVQADSGTFSTCWWIASLITMPTE